MKKFKKGICFGTWDGMHAGHLTVILRAKSQCEHLIVGVSDDEYVIEIKGKRPLIEYQYRKMIVESLPAVDEAIRQYPDSKLSNCLEYMPEVIFVGAEYENKKDWEGYEVSELLGIPIVFIKHDEAIHSSDLRYN